MNERIRQLAVQANTIGDWGEDITEGRYFVYPNIKNLEKFAELIVRECALTAGLMEHEGRKNIGAQLLDNFEIEH